MPPVLGTGNSSAKDVSRPPSAMEKTIATDDHEAVPSPCNKVCTLDPSTGLCLGCRRTMDEIARWSGMTNEERRRALERIAVRREAQS